jgi:hypothetical protein
MAEFRFPREYCYILNQYYAIMSLRHTRPPVQQIPIKVCNNDCLDGVPICFVVLIYLGIA